MPTPIEVPTGIVFLGLPISPSTYIWLGDFSQEC